jgi:hypothetical protein
MSHAHRLSNQDAIEQGARDLNATRAGSHPPSALERVDGTE